MRCFHSFFSFYFVFIREIPVTHSEYSRAQAFHSWFITKTRFNTWPALDFSICWLDRTAVLSPFVCFLFFFYQRFSCCRWFTISTELSINWCTYGSVLNKRYRSVWKAACQSKAHLDLKCPLIFFKISILLHLHLIIHFSFFHFSGRKIGASNRKKGNSAWRQRIIPVRWVNGNHGTIWSWKEHVIEHLGWLCVSSNSILSYKITPSFQ